MFDDFTIVRQPYRATRHRTRPGQVRVNEDGRSWLGSWCTACAVPRSPVPRSPVPLPARGFATSRRNGMNGAQALIRTLAGCGVDVCFSNPGTSEMHFVAALDAVPQMRGVLCMFEGVATGAADGYGRMTGRPAAALLHLGPGLANGLAHPPKAPRGRTPPPAPSAATAPPAPALRGGEPCVILLGGAAVRRPGLESASRLTQATGCRLLCETFPARHERGAGIPALERLAYLAEFATAQLAGTRHLILAGARAPVSFFAYPGQPSSLTPADAQIHVLAEDGDDVPGALASLADLVAPDAKPLPQPPERPVLPDGDLTAETAAQVIGALMPEGAIVSDEANTSGFWLPGATAGAPPHDWLTLTGGAIGQGLPLAAGAAVACPDRKVLALEADGSAMYTISGLWTHAREHLDITTVIFSNRSYAILGMELERVGAVATGEAARSLLDLSRPALDFTALANEI